MCVCVYDTYIIQLVDAFIDLNSSLPNSSIKYLYSDCGLMCGEYFPTLACRLAHLANEMSVDVLWAKALKLI